MWACKDFGLHGDTRTYSKYRKTTIHYHPHNLISSPLMEARHVLYDILESIGYLHMSECIRGHWNKN